MTEHVRDWEPPAMLRATRLPDGQLYLHRDDLLTALARDVAEMQRELRAERLDPHATRFASAQLDELLQNFREGRTIDDQRPGHLSQGHAG